MRARYTDAALDEADDILAHVRNDSAAAAAEVAAIIETMIARLLAFPQLGSQTDVTGVRVAIARPHSYLIFYSVDDDELVIRNVRHPARRRLSSE